MNKIIICYQINDSLNYDYDKLHKAIEDYADTRAKPMNSVYFIKTNNSPTDVYNAIAHLFDTNDRLWCDIVTLNHKWWLDKEVIEWMG